MLWFASMRTNLAEVAMNEPVRIVGKSLDAEVAGWIEAVGLHEGEEVVVLRRAAFGGPLHVRTGSGGEFAVAREVALLIETEKT